MPLEKAKPGTPGFGRNIATEIKAGKPQKQAVAIAYEKARGDADIKPYVVAFYQNQADVLDEYRRVVKTFTRDKDGSSYRAKAERFCKNLSLGARKDASFSIIEKNGEYFVNVPGSREPRGPFATRDEAEDLARNALDRGTGRSDADEAILGEPRGDSDPLDRALSAADSLYSKALGSAHGDAECEANRIGLGSDESIMGCSRGDVDLGNCSEEVYQRAWKKWLAGDTAEFERLNKAYNKRLGWDNPQKGAKARKDATEEDANPERSAYQAGYQNGKDDDAERDLPGPGTTEGNYGIDTK